MVAIKDFLNSISGDYPSYVQASNNVVYLGSFSEDPRYTHGIVRFTISQVGYIRNVFIPFFEGMV